MANDLMKNEQISQTTNDSSGWYPRLRAIQEKTPIEAHGDTMITKTIDPGITEGKLFTSSDVNDFITKLTANDLKTNPYLSHADWSASTSIKVAEKGQVPSYEDTFQKVNTLLTSLEKICPNHTTYGANAENDDCATNENCSDCGKEDDVVDATCEHGEDVTCAYESDCPDNSKDCDDFEDGVCGYNNVCENCIATGEDSAFGQEGACEVCHEVTTYGDCYFEPSDPDYKTCSEDTTTENSNDTECVAESLYSDLTNDTQDSTYGQFGVVKQ